MKNKKVAVAMSGGVDSGVAAALLVKAGYKCVGFHLHLWSEKVEGEGFENKCCSTESLETARRTAYRLGILFYVLNFARPFKKQVVDYFLKAYTAGLTPNPCIACNKFIKFGELLNYVRKLGFDYLATGHYARIKKDHLLMGKDKNKDQSYFLYNLKQNQLSQILFPVGKYQKKEVIQLAKKWHLPVAYRPESQEICFLPGDDYRPFLKRHLKGSIKTGEVVDIKNQTIGQHQGLPLYTVGQRHGFSLNPKLQTPVLPPYYVVGKDIKKNHLIVGFGKETERKEFVVRNVNWVNENCRLKTLNYGLNCQVRIRHQGGFYPAKIEIQKNKTKVTLLEPERGISPGQSAVFYQKDEVLGGGVIIS